MRFGQYCLLYLISDVQKREFVCYDDHNLGPQGYTSPWTGSIFDETGKCVVQNDPASLSWLQTHLGALMHAYAGRYTDSGAVVSVYVIGNTIVVFILSS